MTLEEFRAREKAQEDWAPGWEAIDAAFSALYPGRSPTTTAPCSPPGPSSAGTSTWMATASTPLPTATGTW